MNPSAPDTALSPEATITVPDGALIAKERKLLTSLAGNDSAIVAFSGGVDSTYLAWAAHEALGDRALIVTADSPSLAREEKQLCAELAKRFGWNHRFVATAEADDENWSRNDRDRCYSCKAELFDKLAPLAREHGATLLYGAIPDDSADDRPGQRAATEQGVRAPLAEVGLTKEGIRALSKRHGLPTWDKPQMACLASRVPHGTAITPPILRQIDRAEAVLHELGFVGCRVRHHGDLARIEFMSQDDISRALVADTSATIAARLEACGYRFVTVDLRGYRPAGLVNLTPPANGSDIDGS